MYVLVMSRAWSLALDTACVFRSTCRQDGGSAGSGSSARVDFFAAACDSSLCQCLVTALLTSFFHVEAFGGLAKIACGDASSYLYANLMMLINHEFEVSDLVATRLDL